MRSFTVSETARHFSRKTGETISPQDLSNLFYKRHLDDERCPIVGRIRLIPEDYLPAIERVLLERGLLSDSIVTDTGLPDAESGGEHVELS